MRKIIIQIFMAILFAMPVIGQTVQIQNVTNAVAGPVTVNVDITGFTNAGAVTLHIQYDQSVLSNPTAEFLVGGSIESFDSNNGVLAIEWVTNDAMTGTPITGQFVALHFDYVGSFTTNLNFTGNATSCVVANNIGFTIIDLVANPGSFINGSITPAAPSSGTLTIEKVSSSGATTITLPPPGGTTEVWADVFVPITADGLASEQTGVIFLKIEYDNAKLEYFDEVYNQFTGWTREIGVGTVSFTKTSPTALSITNGALITLHFKYLHGIANITFQEGTYLARTPNPTIIPVGLINGNVADFSTLNLKVFLEGLYTGSGAMRKAQDNTGSGNFDKFPGFADQITVELHSAASYSTVVWSQSAVNLNTDGTATVSVPRNYAGNYYLTIKHRNHIETVSAAPLSFNAATISYDFTELATNAFGNNQKVLSDGKFGIFAGDVDQSGVVNTLDRSAVHSALLSLTKGYVSTDVDGNGSVNTLDRSLVHSALLSLVHKITP